MRTLVDAKSPESRPPELDKSRLVTLQKFASCDAVHAPPPTPPHHLSVILVWLPPASPLREDFAPVAVKVPGRAAAVPLGRPRGAWWTLHTPCWPAPLLRLHQLGRGVALGSMPPKKPSTYMGFIEAAILAQKEAEGSSRQAMTKYILANFGKSDATSFKRALKKGVSSGKLVANGARFKLAGVDFEPAQVDRVEIKDVSEGEGRAAESGDTVVMKCATELHPHCLFSPPVCHLP